MKVFLTFGFGTSNIIHKLNYMIISALSLLLGERLRGKGERLSVWDAENHCGVKQTCL